MPAGAHDLDASSQPSFARRTRAALQGNRADKYSVVRIGARHGAR
jgi:hypothetical protein